MGEEDSEKVRKVRERVVTGVVVVKCGSNPNDIVNNTAHSKLRSDGRERIGSKRGRGKG